MASNQTPQLLALRQRPNRPSQAPRQLSARLRRQRREINFYWYGERAPCPISTPTLTSAAEPPHFKKLIMVQAINTDCGAEKVFTFCRRHTGTIKCMNLDNIVLTSGTWHNALLHLGRLSPEEEIWEAILSGSFTGTDIDLLACGSILF